MASKKPTSKRAAKKSGVPAAKAPNKAVPIDEAQMRRAAVERARRLYDWEPQAILNLDDARLIANLEELQKLLARHCNTADICNYLKKLAAWFVWFQTDYTALRRAMCNVERRAWGGPGDQNLRFCQNGAGNEPADPTPPPIWS